MSVPGTSWHCCFCKTSPQFTFLGLTHQAQARFPSFPEETKKNKVLTSSSCSVSESTTSNVNFHLRQKKTEILAISKEPDLWMLHVYVWMLCLCFSLYICGHESCLCSVGDSTTVTLTFTQGKRIIIGYFRRNNHLDAACTCIYIWTFSVCASPSLTLPLSVYDGKIC